MSKALKGALLSALVFPGLGQVMLRSYVRGVAFVVMTLACLAAVVVKAEQQTLAVLDGIQAAGGAITIETISKAANDAVTGTDNRIIHIASALLALCWVFSIFDAHRIGRKADAAADGIRKLGRRK